MEYHFLAKNTLTIYHGDYGVLLPAGIEFNLAGVLMNYYGKEYGYDICDSEIAFATKSALCLTTKEKSEKWRQLLKI